MNVSKDTVVRTVVLVIALINQVFAILGKGTFDIAEEQIYQIVTLIFTIGASARAWWKNNSFTHEAKLGDECMKELKSRRNEVGGENDANTEESHAFGDPEEV